MMHAMRMAVCRDGSSWQNTAAISNKRATVKDPLDATNNQLFRLPDYGVICSAVRGYKSIVL